MASGHYTWLSELPKTWGVPTEHLADAEKFAWAGLLAAVLIVLARMASARIAAGAQNHIVPESKLSLFGFFDVLVEGFVKFHDSILGKENRQYVPLVGSVFVFILFANLMGLVPGVSAITTTVWINVAIALVVFFYFNYQGMRANGVIGYLKHFCGPLWAIAWLILPIEIFSTCLRVLTLNLRLYWNITADHVVLATFTEMTKIGIPVIFYAFGTFVCFIQAFVFTLLTMVYILLATQHEEEGHH